MRHNMAWTRYSVAASLALLVLVLSLACGSSQPEAKPADEIGLIWEAWDEIDGLYPDREGLDLDALVGSTLQSLLDLADAPPYPFLAQVGRLRGRPPVQVPAELTDVWRALALHRQRWPEIDGDRLVEAAISGMVDGLGDPSAGYFTADRYPEARKRLDLSLEGSYLGIGASVVSQDGRFLLSPNPEDPAAKAGVQDGDVLLAVEGEPAAGRRLQDIVEQVKGGPGTEEGSKVSLRVERAGEPEPLEFDVYRNQIELVSVRPQLLPGGIGYLRITQFRDNTGDQVFAALEQLKRFEILALILDLRSNPGGSMEAAYNSTGQFLPPGSLFITRQGQGGVPERLEIKEEWDRVQFDGLDIVVLVDGATMGEAEAMAAAMQDADQGAVIMGTGTFGNGSSNTFVDLSDGSAIYLPASRWFTPSGISLAGTGVEPDILVPNSDAQFDSAYAYLDQLLPPFR